MLGENGGIPQLFSLILAFQKIFNLPSDEISIMLKSYWWWLVAHATIVSALVQKIGFLGFQTWS